MDPSEIQWRPFQQRPAQCSRGTVCCVNTPPPKGGGFGLRLEAGSVRHTADSGHFEVIIRLWRHLVFVVLHPDLVSDVAAARNPVASRPQVLTPVAFAQNAELAQQLVNFLPSDAAPRETPTDSVGSTAACAHGRG
jgi:hypothetical protein